MVGPAAGILQGRQETMLPPGRLDAQSRKAARRLHRSHKYWKANFTKEQWIDTARHDLTKVNWLELFNPVEVRLRSGHLEQSLVLPLLPGPVDGVGVEPRSIGRKVVSGDGRLTVPLISRDVC